MSDSLDVAALFNGRPLRAAQLRRLAVAGYVVYHGRRRYDLTDKAKRLAAILPAHRPLEGDLVFHYMARLVPSVPAAVKLSPRARRLLERLYATGPCDDEGQSGAELERLGYVCREPDGLRHWRITPAGIEAFRHSALVDGTVQ